MSRPVTVVQYWAGCPRTPNSKWHQFLALVRRCRELGWRNYMVWSALPENPALVEPFREAGCEIVLQARSRRSGDVASILRTYRLLRHLHCDIFHCYNDHTSPLIGAALAQVPVRIWSKFAMSPYYERKVPPRGYHRLQPSTRLSCLLAHRVLALSNAVRDELLETGAHPAKTHVVPGPIDLQAYARAAREKTRGDLGWSNEEIIITTVGHAVPVKGWDTLVEAFARIADRAPKTRLALVGSCNSSEEKAFSERIRTSVARLGLAHRVEWLGQRDDIPAILCATDVFAFPSRSEGQGLALVEALASGLPVVAASVGGIPEMIEDGKCGLLFGREDARALSDKLQSLIVSQELRMRLAAGALAKAEEYRMDRWLDVTIGHYRQLLDRTRARYTVGA